MKKKKLLKSVKRRLKICKVCRKRKIDEVGDYCKKCADKQSYDEIDRMLNSLLR